MTRFDTLIGLLRLGLTRKAPLQVTEHTLETIHRNAGRSFAYSGMIDVLFEREPHAKAWGKIGRLPAAEAAAAATRAAFPVDVLVGRFAAGDGAQNLQALVKLYKAGTARSADLKSQRVSRDVYALLYHLAAADPRFKALLKDNGLDLYVPSLEPLNFPPLHDVTLKQEAFNRGLNAPKPVADRAPLPAGLEWGHTMDKTEEQLRERIGLPREVKK
jgi:hypothetical protein